MWCRHGGNAPARGWYGEAIAHGTVIAHWPNDLQAWQRPIDHRRRPDEARAEKLLPWDVCHSPTHVTLQYLTVQVNHRIKNPSLLAS